MKIIVARLVPAAIAGVNSVLSGRSWRAGTMKTPPPIPSMAAIMPTSTAMMGRKIISYMFIGLRLVR